MKTGKTWYNQSPKHVLQRLVLVVICSCFTALPVIFSQQLPHYVIGAAGNSNTLPSGEYMAWTVGEAVIFTKETTNHIMTQGFHQPSLLLTAVYNPEQMPWRVALFPNPAGGFVEMTTQGEKIADWTAALYAPDGKFLYKQVASGLEACFRFDLNDLSAGMYFLILSSAGKSSAYRFAKQ